MSGEQRATFDFTHVVKLGCGWPLIKGTMSVDVIYTVTGRVQPYRYLKVSSKTKLGDFSQ